MKKYGLLGRSLSHSFSPMYFAEKFFREHIDASYDLFEYDDLSALPSLFSSGISGLNVTIPYKQEVLNFLDELDEVAFQIGAVNTIKFSHGLTKGFNTDVIGFRESLVKTPIYDSLNRQALILGTGGASRAVTYVLKELGFEYYQVSRSKGDHTYESLPSELVSDCHLIINTTPLGTYPEIDQCPRISYDSVGENHLLFDLIYNPQKTLFLARGEQQGASVKGGAEMLVYQAEASWAIWNSE